MAALENTETLTYAETADIVSSSLEDLHRDASTNDALVESHLYPGAYGLLDTMQRYNIDELTVGEFDRSNPRETLTTVFESAQAEMDGRGIPHPDISLYQNAMDHARNTDTPMADVMADVNAVTPYGIQRDLATEDSFSVSPPDTVNLAQTGPAMETVQTAQLPELDAAAQNYQDYDVHLMAYPLKSFDNGITTRDSHAFVVVTEKGADPFDPDNALLVTRAGPDNNGAFGSSESSSGSSFEDEQSREDKGSDGDVYVATPETSANDLNARNVFSLESTTIRGDIGDIREQVSDFREFINGEDINYVPTNLFGEGSNSNTYAGDAYELLTGDEPNNPHHGIFSGHRTPALENDLVNYEETDYAPLFD